MRFFIALAVLVAAPAWADIGPGPTGPFVVVDDNGKLVGGLAGTRVAPDVSSDSWPHIVITLNTSEGMGFIQAIGNESSPEERVSLTRFQEDLVYFATADCSGTPLGVDPNSGWGNPSGPLLIVIPDGQATVYTAELGTLTEVTVGSSTLDFDVCSSGPPWSQIIRPLNAPVGQLLVEFTPPFSIVPASTVQAASVPMLDRPSHWLLVALLVLVFWAYDRGRRRARVLT